MILDYIVALDITNEAGNVAPRGVFLDADDLADVLVFQVTVLAAELMRLPLLQHCLTMPKPWFLRSTALIWSEAFGRLIGELRYWVLPFRGCL